MQVIEVITPYYPRGSITDALLRGDTFCGQTAVTIVRAALLGLRELHVTHRILHRDIKSGNILLTEPPTYAIVADLGVAGRMDAAGEARAVRNPTLYSPPELFSNGNLTVSSDLYSLALVLNELVGGRFPYEAYSRDDVARSLVAGRNPLRQDDFALPIWAPSRLRRIYSKATHQDPGRRFRSAQEMDDALGHLALPCWTEVRAAEDSPSVAWQVRRSLTTGTPYFVEARRVSTGFRLSIKRATASGLRRPAGYNDVDVPSLSHRDAQRFFVSANALAL
jgi:serine/threonine protein kinase